MDRSLELALQFPLKITSETIGALQHLRHQDKFTDLPGYDTQQETLRCSHAVNELLDRLIQGIAENPRKSWVLEQFVPTLRAACREDSEARERFGPYLESVMDILGIDGSDGMLTFYLTLGGEDAV
jgi:hypothetical protein